MEPVVRVTSRPTVEGLERLASLDEDRPVVFAANHHSHVDTPLLLRTLPRPWRDRLFVGAAADYFFPNRVAGAASALVLNAIPMERNRVSRRSALDAAALIDDGWSMLIYPEGGRSPDGWGQPFRGGAAYLAIRCGVPVVPIYLHGTEAVLPKGRNWPRPGRTKVTFGEPLRAADRRGLPPVGRPHRGGGGRARRRGGHRLVPGPAPLPRRHVARPPRAGGGHLAPGLGPHGRDDRANRRRRWPEL